jgi:diguanylate cyclase (GGDEF)-like protein
MTILTNGARIMRSLGDWFPRGSTLPQAPWEVRHRAVTWLLLFHAVIFGVASLIKGVPLETFLTNVSVPALGAYAASRGSLSRAARSGIGAVSLMLSSSVVVHLMNGSIEGHFHFFVMIPVVALYEDWVPFGLAVGVVLIHHGVIGTLAPGAVYDHHSAVVHPWRWAFVHAFFFASACVGAIINWKLHESARSAEQTLTARVRHQAHHDPLTGLPNRTQLLERASAMLDDPSLKGQPLAVLLVDLDRFKDVNDVLGHASGDLLLSRVGPLMASAVRGEDVLCRLGGDEFAAVLPRCDEATAVMVAKRLLELISVTMDIDGVLLNVEASVGIAVTTEFGEGDIDKLLQHADIAMYTAKRARCGYQVYEADQDTSTRERLNLLGEMRQALVNDEFVMHYQPKMTLPDNRLNGVEALARWQHPTRGLLGPGEFIPVAESTGLIVPFTLYVLRKALKQVSEWQDGGTPLSVAVNLSPRCLAEIDLPEQILAMLSAYGVSPDLLELEITENTLAHDPERALATLTELHDAGIKISIDDFGTGYSSMSYLKRLPVSELKVDRSFVMGMLNNLDDGILVRSVVDLGHNLGLIVVAEGVEDQETLEALAAVGCDVAQGFHLARPMSVEAFQVWRSSRLAELMNA